MRTEEESCSVWPDPNWVVRQLLNGFPACVPLHLLRCSMAAAQSPVSLIQTWDGDFLIFLCPASEAVGSGCCHWCWKEGREEEIGKSPSASSFQCLWLRQHNRHCFGGSLWPHACIPGQEHRQSVCCWTSCGEEGLAGVEGWWCSPSFLYMGGVAWWWLGFAQHIGFQLPLGLAAPRQQMRSRNCWAIAAGRSTDKREGDLFIYLV